MPKSTHRFNPFEQFFHDQNRGLVHYIRSEFKRSDDAEDIAQNAFIRIQKLSEDGRINNPKAYLYQIASNLVIDKQRREKLHQNYVNRASTSESETGDYSYIGNSDAISPERILSARAELDAVKKAISAMPIKPRQAFLMHRIKGMSYNDIATEMNVSVSSVEKYILQALKFSRKAVQQASADT